jgi:CRISPR-associated protein Csm4
MKLYKITITPISNFGTALKGDTLFGQMCWAIRYHFGKERLIKLLSSYDNEPFLIMSDGFPSNYLPKPTMPSSLLGEKSDEKKVNRKKIWLTLEELQKGSYQKAKTDKEIHNNEKNVSIIKNALNYRTFTTDDSGAFTPYAEEERVLSQRDIYCLINPKLFSQAELEQSIKFVAQMGYGKNSTIGKGFFKVDGCEEIALELLSKNLFMTLSPSVLEGQNIQKSYYEPFTRFGKHGAELANKSPFKKPILLANSSAVVVFENAYEKPYIGKAIKGHSTHPETVHQGYAIIIPIKEIDHANV